MKYKDFKGLKLSRLGMGNMRLPETDGKIDYDKADFDELLAAGVLTSTDESKKIVYVSLDETIKQQENSGLVCKKQ